MPLRLHAILGWVMVVITFFLVAFYVPAKEATIGASYLIFFIHFPSAVVGLLIFLISGGGCAWYLIRPRVSTDLWAASGVEVGVLAATITLVTGSIWGKAAWGLWWDSSDPRLMTVAILWLTYTAYLVLRSTLEEPVRRARFAAVFGLLATVNVPLVHFAIRLFKPVHHPAQAAMGEPEMVVTRWFGAFAFLVLYTALWRMRYRVHTQRARCHELEEGLVRAGL